MKNQVLLASFLSIACILSCNHYKSCNQKKLSIKKIGYIGFRRSYVDHENHTDTYNDSVMKSNPVLMDCSDSSLIVKLRNAGIIKNDQLLINKFRSLNEPIRLVNNYHDTVYINTEGYTSKKEYYGIIVNYKNTKTVAPLLRDNLTHNTQIDTIDIIRGGFKELVVLENYYIMNGDNYYITVFKVN